MSTEGSDAVGVLVGRALAVALESPWADDERAHARDYVSTLNQLVGPSIPGPYANANATGRTVADLLLSTVLAGGASPVEPVSDEVFRRLVAVAAELEGGLPLEWALRRAKAPDRPS